MEVLHVLESDELSLDRPAVAELAVEGNRIVGQAVGRLREEGSLLEIAARHEAGPIVMGKRGAGSRGERGRLGAHANAKVAWAQGMLAACSAKISSLVSASLDDAVALSIDSRGADMVILSRAVAAVDLEDQMLRLEERGLWTTRTPILIS